MEAPRRGDRRLVAGVVLLHLALTVPLAIVLNVWKDESFALYSTSGTLAQAIDRAIHFELQPPLYFIVLWFWRTISADPVFARFLSVLAVAAALPMVAALSRRLFPRISPAWLTAFVAFNPLVVWAALEIRVYPVQLFLFAALLLSFHHAFLGNRPHSLAPAVFVAIAASLLYTQYYSGFILPALGVGLLVAGRREPFRRYLLAMLVVAILATPLLLWLPGQIRGHTPAGIEPLAPAAAVRFVVLRIEAYLLPVETLLRAHPSVPRVVGMVLHWLARLALIALAFVAVRRGGRVSEWVREPRHRWLLGSLAMLALAFVLLHTRLDPDMIEPRHTLSLLLLSLIAAFALIAEPRAARVRGVWLAGTLGCQALVLAGVYRPLSKGEDNRRVALYLAEHERAGEPILLYPSDGVMALDIYYDGLNPIVPIPRPFPLRGFDPGEMAVRDTAELGAAISAAPTAQGGFWLVSKPIRELMGVNYRYDRLERYLQNRFQVVSERPFNHGVTVRYLAERNATTPLAPRESVLPAAAPRE